MMMRQKKGPWPEAHNSLTRQVGLFATTVLFQASPTPQIQLYSLNTDICFISVMDETNFITISQRTDKFNKDSIDSFIPTIQCQHAKKVPVLNT